MVTTEENDVAALPLVPANPLPLKQRLDEVRKTHTCQVTFREAGGQVTRVTLGPKWFAPPIVWVMSPAGARDVLSRKDGACDRTAVHHEMRMLMGDNLADLPNEPWLPRKRTLQPLFTKQYVRRFGDHMSQAAAMVADGWLAAAAGSGDGAEVDLDADSRRLTMRALGRSVLGIDLDERSYALAEPLNIALSHIADRGMRPINPPRWLPLPSRRRAVAAYSSMHRLAEDILAACRADPDIDAPLVHALIGATDPETGKTLSDDDICNDLIAFIVAGHDTTATTIAYALWALGHHRDIADRVAAEAAALGDRTLTADDVGRLPYTTQVVHEALRLCPPVSVAGRTAMRDIEVAGCRVEAGSMVLVGIYGMQRDPDLWDDPLRFDPERFSAQNFGRLDRWQYIPFGGGTRTCIGDHFAMLELVLAVATVLRDVEITSTGDDFPLAVPFTTVADGPIPARVRARR
ncbi:cytochrome P450 [Mycobacterium manitobense]|uniref:Cytochrome P450 n=1 Tax=[Mycobacterium] manitobense TaxID=190147 RepID=A0A9X2YVT1_9MYCO|nr:cytochrome P450 [[Mycobacterium] manitobense]MCV7173899.1 cytochrome P450 [[Mycobacterium] manitobense]